MGVLGVKMKIVKVFVGLIVVFGLLGCATCPKTTPGVWRYDEIALQKELKALTEFYKKQAQDISYLENQLKEAYRAAEIQDKIWRQ